MARVHRARGQQRAPAPVTAAAATSTTWWRVGLIVIAGIAADANNLSGPFIFDDVPAIVENTHIRSLAPAIALSAEREAPVAGRPIVGLSFAINYALDGLHVRGYHAVNITFHLLCALVLYGLVRRTVALTCDAGSGTGHAEDLAFAVALIWTLHPLNTEVVDYTTERTESMMALFFLSTLYASARAMPFDSWHAIPRQPAISNSNSSRAAIWTAAAIIACALGMACKESMIVAPVAVMLYDRIFRFDSLKHAWSRRWVLYTGLMSTWMVLALLMRSGPRIHTVGFATGVSPWTYLLNQAVMVTRYLRLAIWPGPLVLHYGVPLPLTVSGVLPRAVMVVALIGATALALWRKPRLGFLGALVWMTLAPTSSIIPIATEVGAERRMYLPLAALVALAAVLVSSRISRRRTGALLLAAAALACGARTVLRNREYASPLLLAQTVLERWPTGVAHAMVGTELAAAGRHSEAIEHLRIAARDYSRASFHLGGELFNEGRLDEAIDYLQRFVQQEPGAAEAIRARTILGHAFLLQRKYDEASVQLRLVLSMTGPNAEAHLTALGLLADTLFGAGRFDEAVGVYRRYLAVREHDAGAWQNTGIALASVRRESEAIDAFARAVRESPGNVAARNNLVRALLNQDRIDAATREAGAAVALAPRDPVAHDLLGRALASSGRLADARRQFELALQLDPSFSQAREDLRRILEQR